MTLQELQKLDSEVSELANTVTDLENNVFDDQLIYTLCAAKYGLWATGLEIQNLIGVHEDPVIPEEVEVKQ